MKELLDRVRQEDEKYLEMVSGLDSELFDGAMSSISSLGSVYLASFFVILTFAAGAHRLAFEAGFGLLLTWGVGYSIKHIVQRPRPTESFRSAVTYSFPSGHTATACFLATFYAFTLNQIAVLLHFLALAVGFSRIYLRLHYPSDAVAGSFIGMISGFAVLLVL